MEEDFPILVEAGSPSPATVTLLSEVSASPSPPEGISCAQREEHAMGFPEAVTMQDDVEFPHDPASTCLLQDLDLGSSSGR